MELGDKEDPLGAKKEFRQRLNGLSWGRADTAHRLMEVERYTGR